MGELFAAFGVNWKLLLAQAFNFALLMTALWYFLYRPVLRLIDERREKVAEGVRNAERATQRVSEAEAEKTDIIARASREAEGIVSAAKKRAEEKKAELAREAQEKADALLKDAEARAEEAERQALRKSEKEIAQAAMLAAEKILRNK